MNEMTPDPELDPLFALARTRRVDTSAAEYAFETRLMARLRSERSTASIWAMVSWRAIPFLAACVMGLVVWQSHLEAQADEAEQAAYMDSNGVESLNNFSI